jgi:radical SAM superfamily enzyme YgiQ (UPF0313 family)
LKREVQSYKFSNLEITVDRQGADRFQKMSFPIRYGRYCEVKTPDYLFEFNLKAEVKFIRGRNGNWPHPAEWLKRTDANDWVFYSTGGYSGVFDVLGEYYRPCLSYPSNSVWEYNPFADDDVQRALKAVSQLPGYLRALPTRGLPQEIRHFVDLVRGNTAQALAEKSKKLHQIVGARVAVLPPDTRHVDYNVIPLMIADGCLYRCNFCCFKSRNGFAARTRENVLEQIRQLQVYYGPNLKNYNALFVGNHDALAAGGELIRSAVSEAYCSFQFETAHMKNPTLFMFASVDSFLNAGDHIFDFLNRLPLATYINIGLESADEATLGYLNKPLDVQKVKDALRKMLAVNRSYAGIEVTANFLMGDHLSDKHYDCIIELIREELERHYSKGAVYLSPLMNSRDRHEMMRRFSAIKSLSRLPTYLYLIQRL